MCGTLIIGPPNDILFHHHSCYFGHYCVQSSLHLLMSNHVLLSHAYQRALELHKSDLQLADDIFNVQ